MGDVIGLMICLCFGVPTLGRATTPPTLSGVPDVATFPDVVPPDVGFTVQDAETPAAALLVTAISSDTNLLPAGNIILSGTGTNRTLQLQPAPNLRGTSIVTMVVTDIDGLSATNTFSLRVEEFTPLPTGTSRSYPGRVMWGDYDNDGWLDIVYAGATQTRVMRNLGNGQFVDILSTFPAWLFTFGHAVWGDYNRDGYLDLILGGGPTTRLARNLGNGSFTNITIASFPYMHQYSGAHSWGDSDNDGDLDMLISGEDVNYFPFSRVFRSDGNNTFTDVQAGLVGVEGPSAFADCDRDGKLDVLVSGFSLGNGKMTQFYRNLGNNSFTNAPGPSPMLAYGSGDMCIAWGDYDNDGDPDLFLDGEDDSGLHAPRLFRNDQPTGFTEVQIGGIFTKFDNL